MKRHRLIYFIAPTFLILADCSDNIISECQVCTDNVPAAKTTFADIQQNIFNVSCISCHSGGQPTGGLDLSEGASYDNLVNKKSNASSLNRVEPFNSSNSYLIKALEGMGAPLMPPGIGLSQAKIDSIISWINRGAAYD